MLISGWRMGLDMSGHGLPKLICNLRKLGLATTGFWCTTCFWTNHHGSTTLSLSLDVYVYIYIFLCRHHHIYIQIPDAMRCDHAKLIPNFGRQSSLRQMGRTILLLRFSLLPINGTEVGAISSWVNCQRPRCKFKQWSRYWKHTMTWDDFPDKRPTMLKWTFRKREVASGEMNRCEWLTDSMWLSHVWRLGDPILLMDWPQVLWAKSSISLKQFPHKQCTSGCMP